VKAIVVALVLCGVAQALLDVPSRWTRLPDRPSLVASFKSPSGLVLAVSRAAVPNVGAWIKNQREAYAREVEKGALAASPGSRRTARKFASINRVPTLDLELERTDGTTLVLRILLFRSYALAATLEVPKGGSVGEARAIARKLTGPK
jgi:hypothetical protein